MMRLFSGKCPVCGNEEFVESPVLWPELINAWQLSASEAGYIDRQQGFYCRRCKNNLRAMGLAAAIVSELSFTGNLDELRHSKLRDSILEINRAGNLTSYLQDFSGHRLVEYPEFDMQDLAIPADSYDLVIHSDTLEHIPNPARGLSECYRVLKKNGKCIFTIPIIVDRISRSRTGLAPSYHGRSTIDAADQVVHTEFGADFWKTVIDAGFRQCGIFSFEYPAALVVIARK